MAIFKCKICGGSLEIDNAQSVATCEYCGTKQTLPKLDNERRANLYDRANHFRRNNDFDKAMGIYENILNEDNTDAEAYWSIVLCRYGIEYVEDPATHKRVPTVNRAQFTSIFDDEDYKSAIANADGYQREVYEEEATAINEIQKGILAISQKEEPFDVFVCYKETDTSGRRTQDSVLATELYHELTREGFKVFFSRITLEDKLGVAYEPYIFAALHSAKVMVVLGTRPEHFNAVWVKNEWSRYLALIKNGAKKTLIPAYRDMDPYDLPEEFSHLQAQDMSKLGFMQDLTRGIKKIVEAETPKTTVKETIVATAAAINVAPLLKRAFMFLEDGDFDRADEFCEQVLNQDPENAGAYLGKLMAELCVKQQADLANCAEPFDSLDNYRKIIRFADNRLKSEIEGYITHINERNKSNRLAEQYASCVRAMNLAKSEDDYVSVAKRFAELGNYKDSATLSRECFDMAEIARKDALYNSACDVLNDNHVWAGKKTDIKAHEDSIKIFESLNGWKDSEEKISICRQRIEQIKLQQEQERLEKQRQAEIDRIEAEKRAKRNKKIVMIVSPIVVAVIAFIIVLNSVIIPNGKYNTAMSLMNDGKYDEAISAFDALDGYKDSDAKVFECKYNKAISLMNVEEYEKAILIFEELGNYENSASQISVCKTAIKENAYNHAVSLMNAGKHEDAVNAFKELGSYKDSTTLIVEASKAVASKYEKNGNTEKAVLWYKSVGDTTKVRELMYNYVVSHKNRSNMLTYEYLVELKSSNYRDSNAIYADLYAITVDASIKNYDLYYTVHGGPPVGEVTIRVVNQCSWMNGDGSWSTAEDYTFTSASVNEGKELVRDVTLIYCYRHIITFYDGITGEKLAEVKYESKT